MIISASRRTDIPAFFSEWFYNRIRDGIIKTRNPYNYHQVNQVNLYPDEIDCIVFWTKNAKPMLDKLDLLREYNYYFQYSITPYPAAYEPNLTDLSRKVETFIQLSEKIGKDRVIWRYDPILISDDIDLSFHLKMFDKLSQSLSKHTFRCIISFIDLYNTTKANTKGLNIREMDDNQNRLIAQELVPIANHYGLELHTCAERIDLEDIGISHGKCIDDELISRLIRKPLNIPKDPNQREECGCIKSFDIGAYNTCQNGCKYCYATRNHKSVLSNKKNHDPSSPFLIGNSTDRDHVNIRNKTNQTYIQF
ncbi:MAG: DUF1848 domain-containing protein [Candidatus Cloacimonetes bacterium]|jgi:hypothetical protein|nr:DUF1848 domain-containing protein [Candidatus Cloacimonadota bacterium]